MLADALVADEFQERVLGNGKYSTALYVAAMVDWDMPSRVSRLEKALKKAMKKHLKVKKFSANRINTFVVIEAELKKQPTLEDRKAAELRVKTVLAKYATDLNKIYRKELTYNGDSHVYYDAFKELNVKELKEVLYNRRHGLMDDIEEQIEQIVATASLMVWDVPGHVDDRIILPDVVATIDRSLLQKMAVGTQVPEISDLIDELIIANFAGYFLPYAEEILHHTHVGMNQLADLLDQHRKYGKLSIATERAVRNFIGSISGLQESLKLLSREVGRLCSVIAEIDAELVDYPSVDIHSWLADLQKIDCNSIQQSISALDARVTEVKPQLRLLLKETGRGTAGVSPIELMHPIIEVKAMAGALTQYAAQFDDIPSFTTLSDGIAFESVENETYTKSDEEAMLEAARLFKMYRRGGSTVYALRGVDLAVKEGEFLIIEGSSGSGKTTLLNMLAGLDNPDRGAVFFEEDNLTDLKDRKKAKARRENFSFIFQSYALIPHLDGTENVALPIDMGGLSSDLKKQIQGLLDDVGIGEYADHKPAYLSGGQMQRLGIARALANRPRVIFADEPTGDLDEETGRKVMDLLKKYHEETGVTIVLVTHNPELAEEYATRRIRVEDGQVV